MKILGLFFSIILFFSCSDDLRQDLKNEEIKKNIGLIEFNIHGSGNITFSIINTNGEIELYENASLPFSLTCGNSIYNPSIQFILSKNIPPNLYINLTKNGVIYEEYFFN